LFVDYRHETQLPSAYVRPAGTGGHTGAPTRPPERFFAEVVLASRGDRRLPSLRMSGYGEIDPRAGLGDCSCGHPVADHEWTSDGSPICSEGCECTDSGRTLRRPTAIRAPASTRIVTDGSRRTGRMDTALAPSATRVRLTPHAAGSTWDPYHRVHMAAPSVAVRFDVGGELTSAITHPVAPGESPVTPRPSFSPSVRVWGFRISQSHRGRVALCRSG
jgi:hypothetical protein